VRGVGYLFEAREADEPSGRGAAPPGNDGGGGDGDGDSPWA
jgi:hypothetical protein